MRSINSQDKKDEVPGVARGPENSAPVPVNYHDLVLAVRANVVKGFRQLAIRQKPPAQ